MVEHYADVRIEVFPMPPCCEELILVASHEDIRLGADQDGQRRLIRSRDTEDRSQLAVLLKKQLASLDEVASINQRR